MSAAAEWQELHFTARKDQVEPLEDWLFARGALSITLEDEADKCRAEKDVLFNTRITVGGRTGSKFDSRRGT